MIIFFGQINKNNTTVNEHHLYDGELNDMIDVLVTTGQAELLKSSE